MTDFEIDIYLSTLESGNHSLQHENGVVWQKYSVIDGKVIGEYREYHSNGVLMKKGVYSDG